MCVRTVYLKTKGEAFIYRLPFTLHFDLHMAVPSLLYLVVAAEKPQGKKPELDRVGLRWGATWSWLKPEHKWSPRPWLEEQGRPKDLKWCTSNAWYTAPIKQTAHFMPASKQLHNSNFSSKLAKHNHDDKATDLQLLPSTPATFPTILTFSYSKITSHSLFSLQTYYISLSN